MRWITKSVDYMTDRIKLLFVCAQNRIRSVAAESLFRTSREYEARSAGLNHDARVRVTAGLIGWADRIFVMEKEHRDRIRKKFRHDLADKEISCLFVPDEYELELLRARLAQHLTIPE
jgi:predicted protein tyrosine phosphatase